MQKHEYYRATKEMLKEFDEKHDDVSKYTESLDCKAPYRDLIKVFLVNMKEAEVDEDLYNKVEQLLAEKGTLDKIAEEHKMVFGASSEERELYTLNGMLHKCKENGAAELTPNALKFAINQTVTNREDGNFIDNYLRYVVAANYDDIKHGTWDEAMYSTRYYESTLYGYPLAKMITEEYKMGDGKEYISPESLAVRKSMQGLRIGAYLLKELMKDMTELYPEEPLVSPTVMKSNVNALKLYTQLGAIVYDNGERVEDPINGMDHTDKNNCLVVFSPEAIKKDSEMVIEKPTKRINEILNYNKDKEMSHDEL